MKSHIINTHLSQWLECQPVVGSSRQAWVVHSSGHRILSHFKLPAIYVLWKQQAILGCWKQEGWGYSFYSWLTSEIRIMVKALGQKMNGYYSLWSWLIPLFELQGGIIRQPCSHIHTPTPTPRKHLLCAYPSNFSVNQPSVNLRRRDSPWRNF